MVTVAMGTRRVKKDPFPRDGGWAWAIVAGCFVCTFFMVGTAKSTGMFLTEFETYFNISTSLATMVMGASAIIYAPLAPVCIMLGQEFTERKVIMVGATIGFIGMSLGSLLYSMEYVIATFGVCFGIGNASIYGNCLVILGYYFHNRRTAANGLALAGASIGQFVLPPFIEFLLDTYGLQGCLLLVGGVYFNVVAAASLFRPPSFWADPEETPAAEKDIEGAETDAKEALNGNGHLLTNGKVAPEDAVYKSTSNGDSELSEVKKLVLEKSSEGDGSQLENLLSKKSEDEEKSLVKKTISFDDDPAVDKAEDSADSPLVDTRSKVENSASQLLRYRSFMASTGSLCMRPLSIYGSSVFAEPHDMQIEELEEEEKEVVKVGMFFRKLAAMFDFSVMKSYVAVFLTLTNFFSFFGYFNFVLFLPATVLTKGITKYDKAILVSLCGIGDLCGRLSTAAIGDRQFVTRYKLQACGIIVVSFNVGMFIFADSFGWMAAHCVLYGFFGGVYVSLAAVVIIDFVGLKNMPRLLAVVMLIQGIGASVGQPLLGAVKDTTGSYDGVVIITAVSCLMGGLILLSYPLVVKLEYRRPEKYRLLPTPLGSTSANV